MTTTTPQADATPVAHQNNTSSQEGEELSAEIQGAKAKVTEAERWDRYASRTATVLLVLYALITGAVVCSSVWNNKTSANLRRAEKLLNDLEKEKIRADSLLKTAVETQKVRDGAANELKIKSIELSAEAAARQEYVIGRAEAQVVQAKAEARRQIGLVEKEVAEQQERAAKAERDVLELRERAQSRRFWNEKIELAIREKRPTGNVLVTYDANVVDAPNVSFDIRRTLERMGWDVTTRARDATDPLRGASGVSIFAWKLDVCPSNTAQCVLWDLFCLSSLKDWNCGLDPNLPENSFRIEVLARPPLQDRA